MVPGLLRASPPTGPRPGRPPRGRATADPATAASRPPRRACRRPAAESIRGGRSRPPADRRSIRRRPQVVGRLALPGPRCSRCCDHPVDFARPPRPGPRGASAARPARIQRSRRTSSDRSTTSMPRVAAVQLDQPQVMVQGAPPLARLLQAAGHQPQVGGPLAWHRPAAARFPRSCRGRRRSRCATPPRAIRAATPASAPRPPTGRRGGSCSTASASLPSSSSASPWSRRASASLGFGGQAAADLLAQGARPGRRRPRRPSLGKSPCPGSRRDCRESSPSRDFDVCTIFPASRSTAATSALLRGR